jgi:hypothetical protein
MSNGPCVRTRDVRIRHVRGDVGHLLDIGGGVTKIMRSGGDSRPVRRR